MTVAINSPGQFLILHEHHGGKLFLLRWKLREACSFHAAISEWIRSCDGTLTYYTILLLIHFAIPTTAIDGFEMPKCSQARNEGVYYSVCSSCFNCLPISMHISQYLASHTIDEYIHIIETSIRFPIHTLSVN